MQKKWKKTDLKLSQTTSERSKIGTSAQLGEQIQDLTNIPLLSETFEHPGKTFKNNQK